MSKRGIPSLSQTAIISISISIGRRAPLINGKILCLRLFPDHAQTAMPRQKGVKFQHRNGNGLPAGARRPPCWARPAGRLRPAAAFPLAAAALVPLGGDVLGGRAAARLGLVAALARLLAAVLGAGAAALVAGAYAGIATTPAEILGSLEHHHH